MTRPSFQKVCQELEAGEGGGLYNKPCSTRGNQTDHDMNGGTLFKGSRDSNANTMLWEIKHFKKARPWTWIALYSEIHSAVKNIHFAVRLVILPGDISAMSFIPPFSWADFTGTNETHTRISGCLQPVLPCSEISSMLFPGRDFQSMVYTAVCSHYAVRSLISVITFWGKSTNKHRF